MKNTAVLSLAIMILLAANSCKKMNTGDYTGTYSGTLTAADFVREDVQLTFTNNPDNTTLFLFDIELIKVSENQFTGDGDVVLEIINMVDTSVKADIVSNMSATFVFEDDEVAMDMRYSLLKNMDAIYVRYIGKKNK